MKSKVVINENSRTSNLGVAKGVRVNGRTPLGFREPIIRFGKSYGCCEVVLRPGTRVVSQISSSITEPTDSRPGEGIFTVSVWISPTTTAGGEMGASNNKRPALIARTIEKLFKEHRVVDLEQLCIKYGEKVWLLRSDLHILDSNGSIAEAAVLALLGSLLTFRNPEAYIDKETDQLVVKEIRDCTPVPIVLRYYPVLTSFIVTPSGGLLAEPDGEEEEIHPSRKLLLAINNSRELCYLHSTCLLPSKLDLSSTIELALAKSQERIEWIKRQVQLDEEKRSGDKSYVCKLEERVRREGRVVKIPKSLQVKISAEDQLSLRLAEAGI